MRRMRRLSQKMSSQRTRSLTSKDYYIIIQRFKRHNPIENQDRSRGNKIKFHKSQSSKSKQPSNRLKIYKVYDKKIEPRKSSKK